MKILIVSSAFFPENSPRSFRTTELVREFVRQGHDVTLYLPQKDYDYTEMLKEYPFTLKFMKIDNYRDIEIRGNRITSFIRRIYRRIMYQFFEYPRIKLLPVVARNIARESGHDLLISIAYPHPIHWGITRAFKKNPSIAKKWIADCGDPYMLCATEGFKRHFYFKYPEKAFCRRADYISIPVEGATSGYYPEFHNKLRIIPQGVNLKDLAPSGRYRESEPITFAYAGSFLPEQRNPRSILDFLISEGIDFRFVVYTNSPEYFSGYPEKLGDKLIIHKYVPRKELIQRLSEVDFLINMELGTEVQSPSKLIDYSLSGRPILSIYSTPDMDKEKFRQFLRRDYSQRYIFDLKEYDISNVVAKFLSLAAEQ